MSKFLRMPCITLIVFCLNSNALLGKGLPEGSYGAGVQLSYKHFSSLTYAQSFTKESFFSIQLGLSTLQGSLYIAGDYLFYMDPFGFFQGVKFVDPYAGFGLMVLSNEKYRSMLGESDEEGVQAIRFPLGVQKYFKNLKTEVYTQLVPALSFHPETGGSLHIDLGLRTFFDFR